VACWARCWVGLKSLLVELCLLTLGLEWSRVSSTDGRLLDVVVVVGGRSLAGATPETEVVPVAPLSAGLVMLRPLRALSELDDLCRRAEVGVGI
jgi:hypothetical protein